MGVGFASTWLRQVSPPLLHKTTLTTGHILNDKWPLISDVTLCTLRSAAIQVRDTKSGNCINISPASCCCFRTERSKVKVTGSKRVKIR